MECSFTAPNAGSYYGKWLDAAVREERVTRVLYDPALPVYTSWDLGIDVLLTAIWFFEISPRGEWRWLEYHEDNGQGLEAYAKALASKSYIYRKHFLPHDVEVREMTNRGRSRREFLGGLGVRPIQVVPAANPADRVSAARTILPKSWFDAKGCEVGLRCFVAIGGSGMRTWVCGAPSQCMMVRAIAPTHLGPECRARPIRRKSGLSRSRSFHRAHSRVRAHGWAVNVSD